MSMDNVAVFNDTMEIVRRGYYTVNGHEVHLTSTTEERADAQVFLPNEVASPKPYGAAKRGGKCAFGCENADAFALAKRRLDACSDDRRLLVLNLANPVNPGGGVLRGARAQEESLCRRSSLYVSLTGEKAARYYNYNRGLHTRMGSDAVIISPKVEVVKDEAGELLEAPFVVSVMTCAAPDLRCGTEGHSQAELDRMVYGRIVSMLRVAAHLGYRRLVLGAFGCGAFMNDAKVVSDLFAKALREFDFDGLRTDDLFDRIDFAVLSRSAEAYNFNEFRRNFGAAPEVDPVLDRIRGAMIGGAAGDALGYAVEFDSLKEILRRYGDGGITSYALIRGKALVSDDTQMALFTANGILFGEMRLDLRGIGGAPSDYIGKSYRDWLATQTSNFRTESAKERYTDGRGISWLLDVPELYARRAPGNTCLSALRERNEPGRDYIRKPINHSKGCGTIMRIAPLGLHYYDVPLDVLDMEAAKISAITHGHALGYMPSSVLTHILNRIVYPKNDADTLLDIVIEARDAVCELFRDYAHIDELRALIDRAIEYSSNDRSDEENIRALGEGWVAEEALAVALYCALRYEHDFSAGLIASVNHDGDSDSTGMIAGNILGAICGLEAIEQKWKDDLELYDVILEMSDDLYLGCRTGAPDDAWMRKYVYAHRK